MTLPEFLQRGPLGEIRFVGSRIDLYFVVAALQKGASVEQVAAQYPTVGPALVRSAIEFYRQNRAAVDAYVQSVETEIAHNLATIPHVDAESLRKRRTESPCRS
jgi:uncharacterized protein (DUF433 family)